MRGVKGSITIPTCGHPEAQHKGRGLCVSCHARESNALRKEYHKITNRNTWEKIKADPAWHARRNAQRKVKYMAERAYLSAIGKEERFRERKVGICALCQQERQMCFDHDHATGKFRGWICRKCNLMLGHAEDNVDTLRRAVEYLQN